MFSRPVSSGWNPTPTEISGATRPRTETRPSVGAVTPASMRSKVLLPEPLRPITPTVSPGSTLRSTPRIAQRLVRVVPGRNLSARVSSMGASSYFVYRLPTLVSSTAGAAAVPTAFTVLTAVTGGPRRHDRTGDA